MAHKPPLEWTKRWRKSENSSSDFERHEKISKCKRFKLVRSKPIFQKDPTTVFYAMQSDSQGQYEGFHVLNRHSTENAAKQTCHKAR